MSRPGSTNWPTGWHLAALIAPALIGATVRVILLRWADILEAADNALDCWGDDQ